MSCCAPGTDGGLADVAAAMPPSEELWLAAKPLGDGLDLLWSRHIHLGPGQRRRLRPQQQEGGEIAGLLVLHRQLRHAAIGITNERIGKERRQVCLR